MTNFVKTFFADARGATSIEYAVIAAGISIAIIAGVAAIGTGVQGDFTEVGTALQ